MAYDLETAIAGIRASREFFLSHIKGVRDDQWDWKPYPECKSIREIIAHLISDDRAFIEILGKGEIADHSALEEKERDLAKLLDMLSKSHESLCAFVRYKFANTPLDTPVSFFSGEEPLSTAIAGISSEDFYHAGQVAFIRMATDPKWDYYASIYAQT